MIQIRLLLEEDFSNITQLGIVFHMKPRQIKKISVIVKALSFKGIEEMGKSDYWLKISPLDGAC